ncbi:unnamed protein product [Heterobilharzia americana]|nr:unnamed protein product [Heterobilharzia americana]
MAGGLNSASKLQLCACPQFFQALSANFKQLFSPKLWKNSNFIFYVMANGITGAGVVIPWTFIYDYVLSTLTYLNQEQQIGSVSNDDISWLLSLIGFGLLFGQLFFGLITSQFGDVKTLCINCSKNIGIDDCCCYKPTSCQITSIKKLIIDIVGIELWSAGLGLFLAFNGAMNLCGTNIGGRINDIRGSYQMAFLIAAILPLISFLLMVAKELFPWLRHRSTLSVITNIQVR